MGETPYEAPPPGAPAPGTSLVTASQVPTLSSDERTMAAVAHAVAGLLGLAFVGLAIPLIIYLAYEGRSRYVRFHALQALVFQLVAAVAVWILGFATCMFGFVLAPLPMIVQLYYAYKAYEGSWTPYPMLEKLGASEREGA